MSSKDTPSELEAMKALGFEQVPHVGDTWTYVKEVAEYPPHLTNGKSYLQLTRNQAQELLRTIAAQKQRWEAAGEIKGMEQAKSRVLRRTEIPRDARNPTRDATVALGEQIADIIQTDINVRIAALDGVIGEGKVL